MREIYIGLSMLALTTACYLLFLEIPAANARTFPRIVLVAMFCFGALQTLRALLLLNAARRRGGGPAAREPFPVRRILCAVALLAIYFLAIEALGFYSSGFLFMAFCMLFFRFRRPAPRDVAMALGVSMGFLLVIYVIFNVVLTVQTPVGLFI